MKIATDIQISLYKENINYEVFLLLLQTQFDKNKIKSSKIYKKVYISI